MEPWHCDDRATIYHGDCLEVLRELPDASVDSVVTDPPYGLEFMGKEWDKFAPAVEQPTRSGWDKPTTGAKISDNEGAHGKVAFHRRRHTYRCDGCGKRDGFRNPHDCSGTFQHEWTDPVPVASLTFQAWCQEWVTECLRVLKPGGHLLAFGGTRTWHRLTVAVEDAGFEVRDSIAWLYGSGFPKSLDVSKAIDKAAGAEREIVGSKVGLPGYSLAPSKRTGHVRFGGFGGDGDPEREAQVTAPATPDAARWSGWGTALKPAFEPVVVARKPLTGTVAANVLEHGVGGLNIDGCRIAADEGRPLIVSKSEPSTGILGNGLNGSSHGGVTTAGRWPANVVLDEDQADALNRQSGVSRSPAPYVQRSEVVGIYGAEKHHDRPSTHHGDSGGASRFFYVAKAPARERPKVDGIAHPTVKPLTLMRWLCRLVTPPGGTVLEPFAGSGTTIEAALMEGFRIVAIEREDDYLPLIAARLERVAQEPDGQLTFDASA
jgi:site-specific DNA-methyltransferase (adenine-specific)